MNKEWHEKNVFPLEGTEDEKTKWRELHKQNCNCSNMMMPYRRTSRD